MKDEALHQLIECARLLGQTQAKKGFGIYTQQDSRFEVAMYKSINEHEAKIKEALAQPEQEPVAHCKVRPLRGDESFPKVEIDWVNQPVPGPLYTHPPQRKPLTEREVELIDGMIEVQLHHAMQCDRIANRTMADKQKGWDMERVELLQKLKAVHNIKENT